MKNRFYFTGKCDCGGDNKVIATVTTVKLANNSTNQCNWEDMPTSQNSGQQLAGLGTTTMYYSTIEY
jgi:hypothetical protein